MKTKDEEFSIREELSDAPLLSSLYGRPDGYVPLASDKREAVKRKVVSGMLAQEGRKTRVLPTVSGYRRWWAVAAGISLLIVVGIWRQQSTNQPAIAYKGLASISDEELEAYLEDNLHTLDLALLLETGLIEAADDLPRPTSTDARPTKSAGAGDIFPPEHLDDDTL